jgi:hypothetical protein
MSQKLIFKMLLGKMVYSDGVDGSTQAAPNIAATEP